MESNDIVKIPCEGLDKELIGRLRASLAHASVVRDEIIVKIEKVSSWRDELKGFMDGARLDEESGKSVLAGVESYLGLLSKVCMELSAEIESIRPYVVDEPPSDISVLKKDEKLAARDVFEKKIVYMRREARAIRKDLQVSFSRYEHGLGGQLQHLKRVFEANNQSIS